MIKILKGTTTPLTDMGVDAGICWNAPIDDDEKNRQRALDCLKSGHGRVLEYPDVTMQISEYSARCIRELYTHIIGTTRLQESTRYVNCEHFRYYVPECFRQKNLQGEMSQADFVYMDVMNKISKSYKTLLQLGVSREDAANILPLGMMTSIVLKINLRALEHFMNMRLCSRAYKEIRELSEEMKTTLFEYSEEWKYICDNFFVPNCKKYGYCTESKCCGRAPKKTDVIKGQ